MGIAYAAFCMARYNVAAGNVSAVRDTLGFSSVYMGWVLSAGSWAYAVSGPFTGQMTDHIDGKNGMLVACLGAALCNLSLGTGSSIIGTLGWAYVFATPGAVLFVMALVISRYVENSPGDTHNFTAKQLISPQQILKDAAKETTDATKSLLDDPVKEESEFDLTPKQQMQQLMRNYTFLGYLGAVFFLCWARDGFLNWFLSFFDAVRESPLTSSDTAIIGGAWTMGGFVGGILCGWLSDVIFHSDRVMPIFIFLLLQAIVLGVIYLVSATCSVVVLGALIFLSSVFLLGNYTLLSYTVPSDLSQDIAAGAAGVMTAVGYFSTGLSGAFMGNVVGNGGCGVWAFSLMVASVLAGVFTMHGSYFSEGGMMMSKGQAAGTPLPEEFEEMTPLSLASLGSRRASIVQLNGDFIMSPIPLRRKSLVLQQGETASF